MAGWGGFTTHWYRWRWHDQDVRTGSRRRSIIAVASSVLSLFVAVTGALWWRRASPQARAVYDGLIFARIILPEVVFATALFFLFLKIHFSLGLTAIVIGHTRMELGLRGDHRAGPDGQARPRAGGGGGRPGRDAVAGVPAGHALGADAGDHRRRPAGVHVLVRRRGHLRLPAGGGQVAAAGRHPGHDPIPDHARDQRDRRCS